MGFMTWPCQSHGGASKVLTKPTSVKRLCGGGVLDVGVSMESVE